MRSNTGRAGVVEQYATAYEVQYTAKDLRAAIEAYKRIMAEHPGSREAGYARTQVQNIVSAVVPLQEIFDAQAEMALAHLEQADQS